MKMATLTKKEEVGSPDLAIFTFEPEEEVFGFKAGQFAYLGLDIGDEFVHRLYSIASCPYARDHLEFYIVLVQEGKLTPPLFQLEVGERVRYMGPGGRFTLERTDAPNVLFICTGTGIAPYLSMLRQLYQDFTGRPSPNSNRVLTLMHGVSFSKDLGYRSELEEMANTEGFDFDYVPTVSRPDQDPDWTEIISRGRVNDIVRHLMGEKMSGNVPPALTSQLEKEALLERMLPGKTAVYLCGHPGMNQDLKEIFGKDGYREIYTEDYW